MNDYEWTVKRSVRREWEGRKETEGRGRNLEDMVNTFEMDIGNQYTHYF